MPTLNLDRAAQTLRTAKALAGVETSSFLYWDFKARGAVKSSNALFKASLYMETPYIAYLNDDLIFKPDGAKNWLEKMIRALEMNEKWGFAAPSGECKTRPQCTGRPGDPFKPQVVRKPLAWFAAVIKRECLQSVGVFWEQLIHYGDESDWIQRAWRKGWKQIWVQGVYIKHLRGAGGENMALRNAWARHDGRLYRRRWVNKRKRKKKPQGG